MVEVSYQWVSDAMPSCGARDTWVPLAGYILTRKRRITFVAGHARSNKQVLLGSPRFGSGVTRSTQ